MYQKCVSFFTIAITSYKVMGKRVPTHSNKNYITCRYKLNENGRKLNDKLHSFTEHKNTTGILSWTASAVSVPSLSFKLETWNSF